eukprot:gene995-biopygen7437
MSLVYKALWHGKIHGQVSPQIIRSMRASEKFGPQKCTMGMGKYHDKSQKAICEAPALKYFDNRAAKEGQADASSKGLGFVLMQEGRPVSFVSRALTPAEQYYSQIKKELLA